MPAIIRRLLLAAVFLIGALGLLAMLIWVCPPFRGAVLFATGRASTCSFIEAVRSPSATAALLSAQQRIRRTSRRVSAGDGRFEKWETEEGPFWVLHEPEPRLLFVLLAEQQAGIYEGKGLGVRQGDIVLDCGAHYGVYTRRALKAGARLVVAIEPEPDNVECLRRNFEAEIAQGRVVVCAKGVWDRDELLPLYVDPGNTAAHSFVAGRGSAGVLRSLPLTTIDKMVSELGLPRVDYIKVDIEGAERRALAGGKDTLTRFQPRLAVAVYHLEDDCVAIPGVVLGINPAYRAQFTFCKDWGYSLRHETAHFH